VVYKPKGIILLHSYLDIYWLLDDAQRVATGLLVAN